MNTMISENNRKCRYLLGLVSEVSLWLPLGFLPSEGEWKSTLIKANHGLSAIPVLRILFQHLLYSRPWFLLIAFLTVHLETRSWS